MTTDLIDAQTVRRLAWRRLELSMQIFFSQVMTWAAILFSLIIILFWKPKFFLSTTILSVAAFGYLCTLFLVHTKFRKYVPFVSILGFFTWWFLFEWLLGATFGLSLGHSLFTFSIFPISMSIYFAKGLLWKKPQGEDARLLELFDRAVQSPQSGSNNPNIVDLQMKNAMGRMLKTRLVWHGSFWSVQSGPKFVRGLTLISALDDFQIISTDFPNIRVIQKGLKFNEHSYNGLIDHANLIRYQTILASANPAPAA